MPAANVTVALDGLPLKTGTLQVEHFRIDEQHSNAFAAWKRMGSPQNPSPEQYAQLEKAGQLERLDSASAVPLENSAATLHFTLPSQAVSLISVSW